MGGSGWKEEMSIKKKKKREGRTERKLEEEKEKNRDAGGKEGARDKGTIKERKGGNGKE